MKRLMLLFTALASGATFAQADIEAGKNVAQTCFACHGENGVAVIPTYPSLAGQHPKYLEKQIRDYQEGMKTSGKSGRYDPAMAPMVMALSEQDIKNVSAYYASLPLHLNTTDEQYIEEGKRLYTFGNKETELTACIACHGPRGDGTSLSGFPRISGQTPAYTKAQLEKFRSKERHNDLNHMMTDISKKLTDREIEVLSHYLAGLH